MTYKIIDRRKDKLPGPVRGKPAHDFLVFLKEGKTWHYVRGYPTLEAAKEFTRRK